MSDGHGIRVYHLTTTEWWRSGDDPELSRQQIADLMEGTTDLFHKRIRREPRFLDEDLITRPVWGSSWESVAAALKPFRTTPNTIHLAFVDGSSGPLGMGDVVPVEADPTQGDRMCYVFKPRGWIAGVVAHELLHCMGAVHPGSPRGNLTYHATGHLSDIMIGGGGSAGRTVIDAHRDSYYSAGPAAGSWLAKNPKWNVANNPWLIKTNVYRDPPALLPTVPPGGKMYVVQRKGTDELWMVSLGSAKRVLDPEGLSQYIGAGMVENATHGRDTKWPPVDWRYIQELRG